MAIKFNDEHIIGSPYTVLVAPDEADLKRISVMPILSASEKDIPVYERVHLHIRTNCLLASSTSEYERTSCALDYEYSLYNTCNSWASRWRSR